MNQTTLEDFRNHLNLTQEEFTKRLNISLWELQKWEQKSIEPNKLDEIELEKKISKLSTPYKIETSNDSLHKFFNGKISEIIDFIFQNEEKFKSHEKWQKFLKSKKNNKNYISGFKATNAEELEDNNKEILTALQVLYNNEKELLKYKLYRDWIENKELKAINNELTYVSSKIQS